MNLAGLTVAMCPNECSADGCVISGKPYCAHPRKGGLHAGEMQDNGALRRIDEAQQHLGHAIVTAQAEARKNA